jgi:hypothetical protein
LHSIAIWDCLWEWLSIEVEGWTIAEYCYSIAMFTWTVSKAHEYPLPSSWASHAPHEQMNNENELTSIANFKPKKAELSSPHKIWPCKILWRNFQTKLCIFTNLKLFWMLRKLIHQLMIDSRPL